MSQGERSGVNETKDEPDCKVTLLDGYNVGTSITDTSNTIIRNIKRRPFVLMSDVRAK